MTVAASAPDAASAPADDGEDTETDMATATVWTWARPVVQRLAELVVLVFAISTLLFFLLRLSGDPAQVVAGEGASAAQVDAVRSQYGFDDSSIVQYGRFLGQAMTVDFGNSIANGQPALEQVLDVLPSTLVLTMVAIVANIIVAIPLGAWLGARPDAGSRQVTSAAVFIAQGIPGYIVGLLLIQVFAVWLEWLPSVGNRGVTSWVLPALTLSAFLAPKLTRITAAAVAESMREDYVRTAIANGASSTAVLWRHAVPNALLGTVAVLGVQFSYLLSGAVVTEHIFAWPGIGQLLVSSVTTLDFPIVQAAVFVTAVCVFAASTLTDILFRVVDPRLRRRSPS